VKNLVTISHSPSDEGESGNHPPFHANRFPPFSGQRPRLPRRLLSSRPMIYSKVRRIYLPFVSESRSSGVRISIYSLNTTLGYCTFSSSSSFLVAVFCLIMLLHQSWKGNLLRFVAVQSRCMTPACVADLSCHRCDSHSRRQLTPLLTERQRHESGSPSQSRSEVERSEWSAHGEFTHPAFRA